MAPTKALCNEVCVSWREKFKSIGLTVALVTGDLDDVVDFGDLKTFQLIITTPEKWDAITRKWKEHRSIADMIKLVLIDEVHLVGDEWRGPTLEAIVSRFKSFQSNRIRFIAASASLPNIEDISKWFNYGESVNSIKTFQFVFKQSQFSCSLIFTYDFFLDFNCSFNENQRTIPLKRYVYGYLFTGNQFQFNNKLTYELTKIVNRLLLELSAEKQILVSFH